MPENYDYEDLFQPNMEDQENEEDLVEIED